MTDTSTKLAPALTAEEWAPAPEFTGPRSLGRPTHTPGGYRYDEAEAWVEGGEVWVTGEETEWPVSNPHGLAALCLHGHLTREHLGFLRMMIDLHVRHDGVYTVMVNQCRELADLVESLLPPEGT